MTDFAELELYLLRHAHAGDASEWAGDDDLRPLSRLGRHQAQLMGEFLALRAFTPDVLLSSPRTRARQTAEIVGGEIGVRVALDDRLAAAMDLDDLSQMLEDLGSQKVVLVGHDPDFTELAGTLAGCGRLPMRKGALARFDVELPLMPGAGTLRWLVPPELLGA
ncbi:MAG TPA: histidine phosphatase family protein [Candidatus Limnocylindrales bacterium]|nr:histidine phosphatase family protein [Candidatus Limnocylindrales bacterium]